MPNYPDPGDVQAPKESWSLVRVLDDGATDRVALAIGHCVTDNGKREPVLALRWNGTTENPIGSPQSRGIPTWFIVPEKYRRAILDCVPDEKRSWALGMFPQEAK